MYFSQFFNNDQSVELLLQLLFHCFSNLYCRFIKAWLDDFGDYKFQLGSIILSQ